MKLPIDGKWSIDHSSDKGFSLFATKNMQFDDRGYATLANRVVDVFDENDNASMRTTIGAYQNPDITKIIGLGSAPFSTNLTALPYTLTLDGLASQPTGNNNSSQAYYFARWTISTSTALRWYSGSAWTDPGASLTSGVRHPLAVHRGNNTLLAGNGAQVKQFNTSYAETTNLTLPSGIEVVGIAYNRNFAAIVTWDANGREAGLYIWDGATAAANYYYPLGSFRALFVGGYKDTFITINGLGQILEWDSSGLKMIDALPDYFTSALMSDIDDRIDVAHDTAIIVDGDRILFNIQSIAASKNSETDAYNPNQPSGLWCEDPAIGLYHRHAPSGAKLSTQLIAPANISAATDTITAVNVPATGTPVIFSSIDLYPYGIGGLLENTIYYVIKLTGTTFKVAATRADAAAGTAIDITSVGSTFSYGVVFIPESDFGQVANDGYGGLVTLAGPQLPNTSTTGFTLFQKYLFGVQGVLHNSYADDTDGLDMVLDRGENRGYVVWQKIFSPNVTEAFQKLYVKARHIFTADDKVIVKYRTSEKVGFPIIARDFNSGRVGTWTNQTTFTTTVDLSAVLTDFNNARLYEVEIIAGAGSGYLAHITNISFNAGTYTVTLDETIRNINAADTFYFVIDNWEKLLLKGGTAQIDTTTDPNYAEFPIAKFTKWIQFKIELRGFRVAIEELEIVNSGDKPAL